MRFFFVDRMGTDGIVMDDDGGCRRESGLVRGEGMVCSVPNDDDDIGARTGSIALAVGGSRLLDESRESMNARGGGNFVCFILSKC
mmetsp:Transcript_7423/g.15136  ORF Transcript_7423/g.15136 Transcript_7423/m.15136 type:complete len:86 (+) Transcript_7423:259-516(+)